MGDDPFGDVGSVQEERAWIACYCREQPGEGVEEFMGNIEISNE